MAISLILSIDYEQPPDISARKWSDFSKNAMRSVAKLWENRYLPLHFEGFAAAKYGYQPRKPKYRAIKRKQAKRGNVKKGGDVALVYSGTLESQMARAGILRVFPRRLTLIKPAGTYVTSRPRRGQPNMVKEIVTVVPSEDRKLTEAHEKSTIRQMTRFRARRKVTV